MYHPFEFAQTEPGAFELRAVCGWCGTQVTDSSGAVVEHLVEAPDEDTGHEPLPKGIEPKSPVVLHRGTCHYLFHSTYGRSGEVMGLGQALAQLEISTGHTDVRAPREGTLPLEPSHLPAEPDEALVPESDA